MKEDVLLRVAGTEFNLKYNALEIYLSGCKDHICEGCHNEESWDFGAGQPFDDGTMGEIVSILNRPWVQGLTLSGGNPLDYQNLPEIHRICRTVKELCPNKDIWLYSGYELSESDFFLSGEDVGEVSGVLQDVLQLCDVVVDGPYVEALRDVSLAFRGSSNQRLIDVKKTREVGQIELWKGGD